MKRRIFVMTAAFLLMACLLLPVGRAEAAWDHVADMAGLLTEEERQELEGVAEALTERYDFGVYIITLEDYKTHTHGDIFDAALAFYRDQDLGRGSEKNGVLLCLSMEDRDYTLLTNGAYGNYAFDDGGREYMTDYFLDDFAEDDWYDGFADYLTWCGNYLEAAKAGDPYSYSNIPMDGAERMAAILGKVAVILIVPLVIAGIVVLVLTLKLKSVAKATEAYEYVAGDLQLTGRWDRYSHTTRTRRKISTSSSGSSSVRRSGSASGTSGKF